MQHFAAQQSLYIVNEWHLWLAWFSATSPLLAVPILNRKPAVTTYGFVSKPALFLVVFTCFWPVISRFEPKLWFFAGSCNCWFAVQTYWNRNRTKVTVVLSHMHTSWFNMTNESGDQQNCLIS